MKKIILLILLPLVILAKTFSVSFDISLKAPLLFLETDYKKTDIIFSQDLKGEFGPFMFPGVSLVGLYIPLAYNDKAIGELGFHYTNYYLAKHCFDVTYDFEVFTKQINDTFDFLIYVEPVIGGGFINIKDIHYGEFYAGCSAIFEFQGDFYSPYLKAGIEYNFLTTKISRLTIPIGIGLRIGDMVDYKQEKAVLRKSK